MFRQIRKLLVRFWRVSCRKIIEPDYIIIHSYGLRSPEELPDAGRKAVEEASRFALLFPKTKILMASSNYFWLGCVSQENNIKLALLKRFGIMEGRIVLLGGVKNTLEEIKRVRASVRSKDSTILSIADEVHTRSVRSMFEKILPETQVIFRGVEGDWDDPESPLVYGRSNWRWLIANVVRQVGYYLIGERIISFHHPLKKK